MIRGSAALALCLLCAACEGSSSVTVSRQPQQQPGEPDPVIPGVDECDTPPPLTAAPVPMRRLTRDHVEHAVKDVLGVTASLPVSDERLFTFRSNVSSPVDGAAIQSYLDFAESVTAQMSVTACTAGGCKAWLLDDVGRRLFRRPLEGAQRTRYAALYDEGLAKDGTPANAARWVVQAMLQSPAFLYLDEPVDDGGFLDGYAVASRLAQAFWGTNPDAALLDAAKNGELSTADGVRTRARAMLKDPRSERGLEAFVSQWLDVERLRQTDARPDLAALGAATLAAMEREPAQLFRQTVSSGGSLASLLTTSSTATSAALSSLYGSDIVAVEGERTLLNPLRRAGLLTLPGVVASLAHAGATSPTLRGHAILSSVMCTPPGAPPAGVSVTLPEVSPDATTRERLEAHFSSPACSSCHQTMDGMGFAFEHYDALGKWRDQDRGKPIDDRSEFRLGLNQFSVTGAVELVGVLAEREEVATCFTKQWTRYATGIPERSSVGCYMKELAGLLDGPGGLEAMMVELAASEYLRKADAP